MKNYIERYDTTGETMLIELHFDLKFDKQIQDVVKDYSISTIVIHIGICLISL